MSMQLRSWRFVWVAIAVLLGTNLFAVGQLAPPASNWIKGPARVPIGSVAEINLPAGYWCINQSEQIRQFAELSQNPYDPADLAVVMPDPTRSGSALWFMQFSFVSTGYVRDDEKDQLNKEVTDAILKQIRDATLASNSERQKRGWEPLYIDGWHTVPFFDDQTKNLTWATNVRDGGGSRTVNYTSRVLGRTGVMSVLLVAAPEQVAGLVPTYESLTGRLSFVQGQTYSEFRSGDKVAAYGLTGLATGGIAVVVAKSWKGFVAIGAAILAALGGIIAWVRERLRRFFLGPQLATASAGGPSADGGTSGTDAAVTHAPVVKCDQCGQSNRLKLGQLSAKCGRCGAKLL